MLPFPWNASVEKGKDLIVPFPAQGEDGGEESGEDSLSEKTRKRSQKR